MRGIIFLVFFDVGSNDHRDIHRRQLYPGLKVTMDVATELKDFTEMEPTAVRLVQIQGTKMSDVPVLVNVCCLADAYTTHCSIVKQKDGTATGQWVCLWLSSVCNFDNWFSLRLFNKESPRTSMTKICKPVLVQHPMTITELLEDLNIMIVDHCTIKSISRSDDRLKMEIAMYEK